MYRNDPSRRGFLVEKSMPIITRKNGYYPYEEVVFVGPDTTGSYSIDNSFTAEGLPVSLNPLEQSEIIQLIDGADEPENEEVFLDYSHAQSKDMAPVLRVTGVGGLYNRDIYLSVHGEGLTYTGKPKPMPRPGEIQVYGRPVREMETWRRKREGNSTRGKVIGWERYDREAVRGRRERL